MTVGITFDVIPTGPDETPETAIARVYADGATIGWDESGDGFEARAQPLPPAASEWQPPADWRDPVIEQLEPLHPWIRENERGNVYLFADDAPWQVELHRDDATLRLRRGLRDLGRPVPTDAQVLRAFDSIPCVVHQPDNGWWMLVADVDDDFSLL